MIELKKLKEAAAEYIKAKRAQKGYESLTVPDDTIDAQMLGKEKGGKSIFTTRGRDRYDFAVKLVKNITKLEMQYGKFELDKETGEFKPVEQGEIKKAEHKKIEIFEQVNKKVKEQDEIEKN